MDAIEPWHVVVLAIAAVILLYAPRKLPEMSRSLGRSLRIFKDEVKGTTNDIRETRDDITAIGEAVPDWTGLSTTGREEKTHA